jgi:transcriptional regulator of acetoin/glycerol metabolism
MGNVYDLETGSGESRARAEQSAAYQRGMRLVRQEYGKMLDALLAKGGDVARTAAELGTDPQHVRWVKIHSLRGADRAYPEAAKAEVRGVLEAHGGNVKRTARETGVPVTTVRQWRDEWRERQAVASRVAAGESA